MVVTGTIWPPTSSLASSSLWASPAQPALLELYMAVMRFYMAHRRRDLPLSPELVAFLREMYHAAKSERGAHTHMLMRAVEMIGRDVCALAPSVRVALAQARSVLLSSE
jgi:hypothetical protein